MNCLYLEGKTCFLLFMFDVLFIEFLADCQIDVFLLLIFMISCSFSVVIAVRTIQVSLGNMLFQN